MDTSRLSITESMVAIDSDDANQQSADRDVHLVQTVAIQQVGRHLRLQAVECLLRIHIRFHRICHCLHLYGMDGIHSLLDI